MLDKAIPDMSFIFAGREQGRRACGTVFDFTALTCRRPP